MVDVDVFGSSLHAMAVTFATIGCGTVMRARGVISPTGQREMSALAVQLLLPAFNFSALVAEVSWPKLLASKALALCSLLHVLLGLALGLLLCHVGGRHSAFLRQCRGQVLVLCAFCNGTAMPMPLFRALLVHPKLGRAAEAEGVLAITIYGTVWRLLLWTLGITVLEASSGKGKGRSWLSLCSRALFNSNTLAALAGLAIALTGSQDAVFGGPLAFLKDACGNVAKASHTMLLLSLGAALWPVPSASSLDWRGVCGVCGVKLLLIPLITLAVLSQLTLRPVVGLVMAIEGCVPSALQLSMMVQSVGQDARPCTVICFWQHAMALCSMTLFLALSLARLP